MLSQTSLLALLFASQALGSPIVKRQTSATDAANTPSSVVVSVSSVIASALSEASMSVTSGVSMATPASASSMMMSGMSSMAMASSAAAPVPTSSMMNTTAGNSSGNALYPCPDGYSLTYVEEQMSYPNTTFSVLLQTVGGFQNASYFGYVNGTGGDMVGATRHLVSGHNEVLVSLVSSLAPNNNPGSTVARQSVFNLTNGPIEVGTGASISNYSTVLQVYRNTSATNMDGMVGGGEVGTVKLFSNFCASNQTAGALSQRRAFEGALENIAILVRGGTLTGENYSSLGATGVSTISSMSSMSAMNSMSMSSMAMSSGMESGSMSMSSMMASPAMSSMSSMSATTSGLPSRITSFIASALPTTTA